MISISLRREGHDPPVLTSNMTRQLGKLRSFTGGLSPTGRELRLPSFFFFYYKVHVCGALQKCALCGNNFSFAAA